MREGIAAIRALCRRLTILLCAVAFLIAILAVGGAIAPVTRTVHLDIQTYIAITGPLCLVLVGIAIFRHRVARRIELYATAVADVRLVMSSTSSTSIGDRLAELTARSEKDPLIKALVRRALPAMTQHREAVRQAEAYATRKSRVQDRCAKARKAALARVEAERQASPVLRAQRMIEDALRTIKNHKADAERQLDEQREKSFFKWWLDLTRPVFTEVDARIDELEGALRQLKASGDIERTKGYFDNLNTLIRTRTATIQSAALAAIPKLRQEKFDDEKIVRGAFLFSAMSVPVSAWSDISQAGDVFDSLRAVNGNYAGMSDADIWLDTLLMPGDQLAGLAALTKGAYFEQLVEADFGGARFEHFNHPDTDILIDGVAYQIKATDSVDYVNSVPDGIPVISTTEVAHLTDSIDGGYNDADLTELVDLALGGTVVDIADTAFDSILAGAGGIGLFAAIAGINSASSSYKKSGDAISSLEEGMGVTITASARNAVNLAELATRAATGIVTSKPMRFAGRMFLKAGEKAVGKVDKWLEQSADETTSDHPAPRPSRGAPAKH
jgi:hypothetical protein